MTASASIDVTGAAQERLDEVLTPEALDFLAALHREFDTRRRDLLAARKRRYADLAGGGTLDFLPDTKAIRDDDSWRVADPAPGLDEEPAAIRRSRGDEAFVRGGWDEARSLFTATAVSDEYVDFLTLPAYERML